MTFIINNFIEHSIPAIFNAIGVTLVALLVMFFHFLIKQKEYKKLKNRLQGTIDVLDRIIDNYTVAQNSLYEKYDIDKKKVHGKLFVDGGVTKFVYDLMNKQDKNTFQEIFNLEGDAWECKDAYEEFTYYYEDYNFRKYIVGHLNNIYPDKDFEKLKERHKEWQDKNKENAIFVIK